MSALTGNKENAINGQCSKGNACSFRDDEKKRGQETQSSSTAPKPRTQNDGKSSLKGKSRRGRSPLWKGDPEDRCKDYLNGNCILPKLQNTIGMHIR